LTFTVRHELWDGNIHDHADQGVSIAVMADVAGKATTLLRFNCFDFEKSYEYGPENPDLKVAGPEMLGGASLTNLYRMDPITDGKHSVRARDAAAADGRLRSRDPRVGRYRRHGGQGLHGRDRAFGVRPLLERRALPLWPAQQEPSHLLGPDVGRRSARVDAGAV